MANEGPPGVSPCPARCRRGEHAADRLVRPRRPAGAAVGPSDFPAGAALEKAPATPRLHALQHRLRPYQLAAGPDACPACPDDDTPLPTPRPAPRPLRDP